MNDYIFFMDDDWQDDAAAIDCAKWGEYIATLRKSGQFDGGSPIGSGECLKKGESARPASTDLTGFMSVRVVNLVEARRFLLDNPVCAAAGTVEIRELLREG